MTSADRQRAAELFVQLLELLAGNASAPPTPVYADAEHNPLGSARAFLDAARRGDFETFKIARRVSAKWSDVTSWLEGRKVERQPRAASATLPSNDAAVLEAMGAVRGPRKATTTGRNLPPTKIAMRTP